MQVDNIHKNIDVLFQDSIKLREANMESPEYFAVTNFMI